MNIQRIQQLCEANGMNFSKLEKAVGLGNGVIGKWQNSSPRVDSVKLVADFFGVTVDDLLKTTKERDGNV